VNARLQGASAENLPEEEISYKKQLVFAYFWFLLVLRWAVDVMTSITSTAQRRTRRNQLIMDAYSA